MTTHVMLVEDEAIAAVDIQLKLEPLGYLVTCHAMNGEQAVALARDLSPEIILMDVDLGAGIDGIATAQHIRKFSGVPFVFMARSPEDVYKEQLKTIGEYGFLDKPFKESELRNVLEIVLYKHEMKRKLRENDERMALVMRAVNDGIWDWDLKTNEINFSPRWLEILGFKEGEIRSTLDTWFQRIHPDDRTLVQQNLDRHLGGTFPSFECEYRILHANGNYLWVFSRGLVTRDESGVPSRIAGSQSDISARKFAEDRLAHDTLHDALTGLPNRLLFMDRLENRLNQTKRDPRDRFAIMFIDLDRFKVVNDSLGHAVGDQLLTTVAYRLKKCLRPEDTVARLGGDEFGILINEMREVGDAIRIAERIQVSLIATTMLGTVERSPTASIGIALYNNDYENSGDMLRDADSAMYRAKSMGGNRYQIFDESMHTSAVELLKLEAELKRGIQRQEWQVDYQPIVSLAHGEMVGVEALVRWRHPQRGIISPIGFIHVAEDTGLIVQIGEYVLRTACKQTKAWRDAGQINMWVSVNLSARQFQDMNLVSKVAKILHETGLPGDGLRLEITESIAIIDMEYTIRILNELNALGVYTSLDDFGTGYSSLNYLQRFPLKCLKIDQSFVQEILISKKGESLAAAIISMARSLDLEVVAEGVEKKEQLDFLRTQLCDNVQGFFLSHPISANELQKTFRTEQ